MPPTSQPDEDLKSLWDFNLSPGAITDEGKRKIEGMRSTVRAMKDAIITLAPHSRERSLALTNMEVMSFYAVAAVARTHSAAAAADSVPEEDKALESERNNKAKET